MSLLHRVELGMPSLLDFSGPDAIRYLNGQLTQDVRRVAGEAVSMPSCVTDAKGRLQHRVRLLSPENSVLWVAGRADDAEALEARLTRYLIADDVEVVDLTGRWRLVHFIGLIEPAPAGVVAREANRYGVPGCDWWIPANLEISTPDSAPLEGDALEALRIKNEIPEWGKELEAGMLPPEAGLDQTDISYAKGCYIGQEVISRIKSAGKVNRRLTGFLLETDAVVEPGDLVGEDGKAAGEITSISPIPEDGVLHALGYLKRTAAAGQFVLGTAGGGPPIIVRRAGD